MDDDYLWGAVFMSELARAGLRSQLQLLPVLKVRYGDMLREDLISVELDLQTAEEWRISVWVEGATPRTLSVGTGDDEELGSAEERLMRLFAKMDQEPELLEDLRFFKPRALIWLQRCAAAEDELFRASNRVDAESTQTASCRANLKDVADHFAPDIAKSFVDKAIKKLRASSAHGVDAREDVKTEWDELGFMQSASDHLLAQMGLDTLAWTLEKQFKALDESEKLLLWIKYGDGAREIASGAGEYSHPSENDGAYEQVLEQLRRKVVSAAVNDWEKKSDRM